MRKHKELRRTSLQNIFFLEQKREQHRRTARTIVRGSRLFQDQVYGTPFSELIWVDCYNGKILQRQFFKRKPAYTGAIVADGRVCVLPVSGCYRNNKKKDVFLDISSPGGI